jgi:membrane protease YdiL (CAAX protease family)
VDARPVRYRAHALLLLSFALSLAGAWVLYSIGTRVGVLAFPPPEESLSRWDQALAWSSVWWRWLPIGVLSALVEEWVFRSVLLGGLLLPRMRAGAAVLLSSLAFGLVHGPQVLPAAFSAGVILGGWYVATRKLLLCVGLHAALNILSYSTRQLRGAGPPGDVVESVLAQPQLGWLALWGVLGALLAAGGHLALLAWRRGRARSSIA